jgi:hypothetical protein
MTPVAVPVTGSAAPGGCDLDGVRPGLGDVGAGEVGVGGDVTGEPVGVGAGAHTLVSENSVGLVTEVSTRRAPVRRTQSAGVCIHRPPPGSRPPATPGGTIVPPGIVDMVASDLISEPIDAELDPNGIRTRPEKSMAMMTPVGEFEFGSARKPMKYSG